MVPFSIDYCCWLEFGDFLGVVQEKNFGPWEKLVAFGGLQAVVDGKNYGPREKLVASAAVV